MDTNTILIVVTGLVIMAVGIYQVRANGKPVDSISSALDAFHQASRLVDTYAMAADQLVAAKKLPKDQRMGYVINMVLSYMDDLDIDQIRGIIEGWVAEQKKYAEMDK